MEQLETELNKKKKKKRKNKTNKTGRSELNQSGGLESSR